METKGIGQFFLMEMAELDIALGEALIQVRVTKNQEIHLLLFTEVADLPEKWEFDGNTYSVKTELMKIKNK